MILEERDKLAQIFNTLDQMTVIGYTNCSILSRCMTEIKLLIENHDDANKGKKEAGKCLSKT